MKLYMHLASTTSRAVAFFVSDNNLPVTFQTVDIFSGEHVREPFISLNPNQLIPVLDDDGFILTESSAILKYLAEKTGSPAYPQELQKRARVNETMDWFNSNLYRDSGYGLIYPQVFPSHKRPSEESQRVTVAWGKEKSEFWLKVLNDHIIGSKRHFLCGDSITIADYFGFAIIQVGEVIGCKFSSYPNIDRWLRTMEARPAYAKTFEVIKGFAKSLEGQKFVAIS